MRRMWVVALLVGGLTVGASPARAALVTSSAGFVSPTVVNFNQFGPGFTFTAGPLAVGSGVTWQTSFGFSVIGTGNYGLVANGIWNANKTGYTGLNTGAGSMTYQFGGGPVAAVGGFINYAPGFGPDVIIEALGVGNVVLESYNINLLAPIITPGGINAGAFRGIERATADIVAFRVSNQFVVLDDLTFSQANLIPEPASLTLFGFAAVGLLAYRRRGRA